MPTRQAEPHGAARVSSAGGLSERGRIVAGKLSAPVLRAGIVDRPALLERLQATTHAPVVLVSAPAGYGKTTLLALWRELDERPFAWVTLDASDSDPIALVAALLSALTPVAAVDASVGESLEGAEAPLEEYVLPSLAQACVETERPFVLVLDDVHLVTGPRALTAIGYLAERLPPGCQLALSTRTDPPLPLGSWRAHGRLAEVRATELALQDIEADALLAAAGVHLAASDVARLVERTEGWPAAIYLAALSLREHPHPDEFVDRFAGTTRHVADFLSEDVLARQSENVVDFLLHTCLLDELTASLCDSLIGRSGASSTLRDLERSNLFVVPLDEERHAYRYHHLFAQYLRAELARREPELVAELHRRACRWYREHDLAGRAIAHAQAAGDVDVAGELVTAAWSDQIRDGQIETVRGWIDGFEDEHIERHAPLAIAAAWTAALSGQRGRAAAFIEAARQGSWEGPMPDGTASLESAIAVTSAAFGVDAVSRMRSVAQRALDLEPAPNRHRAIALEILGAALTLLGEFDRARGVLAEAVELAGEESSPGAFSLAQLAVIGLREGDMDTALDHARRAHRVVQLPRMRANLANVATYSVVAHLSGVRGDLESAGAAIERVDALLPQLTEGFWWLMVQTRILLAPALSAVGREVEALVRLSEAEAVLAGHADAGLLPEWHAEAMRKLRPGDRRPVRSQALSEAERRILHLLASDLTLREIGRELYLSLNTVKTHTHAIYRKLGVSSRAQAVLAGRETARSPGSDSPG